MDIEEHQTPLSSTFSHFYLWTIFPKTVLLVYTVNKHLYILHLTNSLEAFLSPNILLRVFICACGEGVVVSVFVFPLAFEV